MSGTSRKMKENLKKKKNATFNNIDTEKYKFTILNIQLRQTM